MPPSRRRRDKKKNKEEKEKGKEKEIENLASSEPKLAALRGSTTLDDKAIDKLIAESSVNKKKKEQLRQLIKRNED